jgi:hypothetical protein
LGAMTESNSTGLWSPTGREFLTVLFQSTKRRARGTDANTRTHASGSAPMQCPALLRPLVRPPLVAANPLAAPCNRLGVQRGFRVGCAPGDGAGGGGGAAAWLSSAVEEKVDELLWREENQSLLEGVEAAERRARRHRAAGGRRAPRSRGGPPTREAARRGMRTLLFDVFDASSLFDVLLAQANGVHPLMPRTNGSLAVELPGLACLHCCTDPPIAKLLCCVKGQRLCDRMLLWYVVLAN